MGKWDWTVAIVGALFLAWGLTLIFPDDDEIWRMR